MVHRACTRSWHDLVALHRTVRDPDGHAGPKFDESPLIRSCLEDSSVPPDEQIDLMLRRVTPEQWDDLRQNSRQRDWADADALPDRFPDRYYRI